MKKIVFALLMAGAANACAAELSTDVLRCSAIENHIKRLECFDGVASAIQKEADRRAIDDLGASDLANWDSTITKSKVDDSTTVVLVSRAKSMIAGRYGRGVRPALVLRCLENTTSMYINFGGHFMADIQNYGRVTFRVDKRKAVVKSMVASTDSQALGFWYGNSSIPFIKTLFGGSTLLIQATPFNESAVTFEIDIRGVEDAIAPLRKACNW